MQAGIKRAAVQLFSSSLTTFKFRVVLAVCSILCSFLLFLYELHLLVTEEALTEPRLEGIPFKILKSQETNQSIDCFWLPMCAHGSTASEFDCHVDILVDFSAS